MPAPFEVGVRLTVGTRSNPVDDVNAPRPDTDRPLDWLCAAGINPVNRLDFDHVINLSA